MATLTASTSLALATAVIIGGLGLYVALELDVPYAVREQKRRRRAAATTGSGPLTGGLLNHGNLCYANSVLQAYASLPSLRAWLVANAAAETQEREQGRGRPPLPLPLGSEGVKHSEDLGALASEAAAGVHGRAAAVSRALCELVDDLNARSTRAHVHDPRPLLLHALGPRLPEAQQDAQEWHQLLAEALEARREDAFGSERSRAHAKAAASKTPSKPALAEGGAEVPLPDRQAEVEVAAHPLLQVLQEGGPEGASPVPPSPRRFLRWRAARTPFEGALLETLACESCGKRRAGRLEPFSTLSLHPPARGGTVPLEQLLAARFAPENLEGASCEACGARHALRRETALTRLPRVLTLHCNRSHAGMLGVSKLDTGVMAPVHMDLRPFLESGASGGDTTMYLLRAVVSHAGNASGVRGSMTLNWGHYMTARVRSFDVRSDQPSRSGLAWVLASDEHVRVITAAQARDSSSGSGSGEHVWDSERCGSALLGSAWHTAHLYGPSGSLAAALSPLLRAR